MPLPLDFKSCDEIDPALIEQAFNTESGSPRDHVLKLVEKMARVAKPGRGAHRILEILARLARSVWLDGALDIILRDFDLATEIDIRLDAGRHFERVRTFSVAVSLSELADWAAENPESLMPLVVFDTRRDDELRLRRATGRITHIPRSGVPLAGPASKRPGPASARPPDRPISSTPRPEAPPPSAETKPVPPSTPADIYSRVTSPDLEAEASPGQGPADVHRRNTPRLTRIDLPDEAYRNKPNRTDRKSTIRIPAVRPPKPAAETDPTDEGWE